ncbi:MAG TPA: glycosyltransferase family 2 protein [Flavobacteriales bacterium]|nr:glycosyltransferase family 2 protein [Flavobacteriales bacterium]
MEKVAIIIPAYNEEDAIAALISNIHKISAKGNYSLHPIVINDCSTDNTFQIASELNCTVLNLPINLGIGGAVQCGYKYAYANDYDLAVRIDGDGQHPPKEIVKLIEAYEKGKNDILIGSRFLDSSGFQSSIIRRFGIKYFQLLIRLFSGLKITDCTSGFRLLNKKVMELSTEYYPDEYPEPESIILFVKKGMRLGEVSVNMIERQGGISSINSFGSVYYLVKVSLAIFFTFIRLNFQNK